MRDQAVRGRRLCWKGRSMRQRVSALLTQTPLTYLCQKRAHALLHTSTFPMTTASSYRPITHQNCQVLLSATEAEVGATLYGCQVTVPLRNTLSDLGHVQGATLIITDNACCKGIFNNTVKQRRQKAMDMRFYWVKCIIAQGQFKLLWRSGRENLAD